MAKKQEEVKGSKVLEILTREYPFERTIMGFLGLVVIVLGVYLLDGSILTINNSDDWWNSWIFGSDTGILIFSIFILLVGIASFLVAVWPFFTPSVSEMRKVTWPNGVTIRNHAARVFGFIIFVAGLFILFDLGLNPLFDLLKSFGG